MKKKIKRDILYTFRQNVNRIDKRSTKPNTHKRTKRNNFNANRKTIEEEEDDDKTQK